MFKTTNNNRNLSKRWKTFYFPPKVKKRFVHVFVNYNILGYYVPHYISACDWSKINENKHNLLHIMQTELQYH